MKHEPDSQSSVGNSSLPPRPTAPAAKPAHEHHVPFFNPPDLHPAKGKLGGGAPATRFGAMLPRTPAHGGASPAIREHNRGRHG